METNFYGGDERDKVSVTGTINSGILGFESEKRPLPS